MEQNSLQLTTVSGVRGYIDEYGTAQLHVEDVARGLGFTQIAASGNEVVRWERVNKYLAELNFVPTSGDGDFIPESVFYRLAMKAKNDVAERFQAQIANEIMPAIRKHGGYLTPQKIEEALLNPDVLINLATQLKEERALRFLAEATVEQQKPLVAFANHVGDTTDLLDMAEFSKVAQNESIPLGRNKMFEWLKNNGYLRHNNEPYQQYINQGIFQVKETIKVSPYGTKVFVKTYVTGKGQIYLIEKLREEFCV